MLEHAKHRDPQAKHRRLPQRGNNQRFVIKPSTEAQRIADQNQFGEHQCLNEGEGVWPVADVVLRQSDSPIPRKYRKKPEEIGQVLAALDKRGGDTLGVEPTGAISGIAI